MIDPTDVKRMHWDPVARQSVLESEVRSWREVCDQVEVRGRLPIRFEAVAHRSERVLILAHFIVPDRDSGCEIDIVMSRHPPEDPRYFDSPGSRVRFLRDLAMTVYKHELDEQFIVNGVRHRDPHQ